MVIVIDAFVAVITVVVIVIAMIAVDVCVAMPLQDLIETRRKAMNMFRDYRKRKESLVRQNQQAHDRCKFYTFKWSPQLSLVGIVEVFLISRVLTLWLYTR